MINKNIIVGQSGGPTAVINGSLYGVISEGLAKKDRVGEIYGMINGIEGFLEGNVMDMATLKTDGELELLRTTPGSYLGSCRYKLPDNLDDAVYPKLFEKFAEYKIGYFFYIGGNDSMDTVSKLSKYARTIDSPIRFIGVPKTIDNDLVETDHTPGFGSAAKYVASTVREVSLDAAVYSNKRTVTIVEIMGRHAGWLTAASIMARKFKGDNPVLVYLPETAFNLDDFMSRVTDALETTPNLVVCISEGIKDEKGTLICEYGSSDGMVDSFGHKMLTGSARYLEGVIKQKLGLKVRSIEFSLCQRCSSAYLSKVDLEEAVTAGRLGVEAALNGETGKMIAFDRSSKSPYEMTCVIKDVDLICNKEKPVPTEWIIENGTDISDAFIEYALPLIQGDVEIPKKDGLPQFAYRK